MHFSGPSRQTIGGGGGVIAPLAHAYVWPCLMFGCLFMQMSQFSFSFEFLLLIQSEEVDSYFGVHIGPLEVRRSRWGRSGSTDPCWDTMSLLREVGGGTVERQTGSHSGSSASLT